MDIPEALSIDLVNAIKALVESGKYNEALQLTDDNKYAGALKDNCWDLIPTILALVNDDIIITKPSLQHYCEQMLSVISQRSNPEEVLLELIEQIEVVKNDAQFVMILKPLREILTKLTVKRGRSLEWCLNAIATFASDLPHPADHALEKEETMLMDSETNSRRIVKIYTQLPSFYRPFIDEVVATPRLKDTFLAFLIDLLGKPFIYLDIEYSNGAKSEARLCAEALIGDISKCGVDVLKFLKYAVIKCVTFKKRGEEGVEECASSDVFLWPEKIEAASLAGLFYVSLASGIEMPIGAVSQLYRPEYVVRKILHPSVHLLGLGHTATIFKGLKLAKTVVTFLPENSPRALLDSRVYSSFCKSLINIAIFCPAEQSRKNSVLLLKLFVRRFDMDGRCVLIEHLIKAANHSGLIGYLIVMYKEFMAEGLALESLPDALKGVRFSRALGLFCHLPHGVESDFVEHADQTIATLNLLRFLTLRDIKNATGIQDHFPLIERTYIDPLREGLKLSKAHYDLKLKEIDEGKDEDNGKISVNVVGETLDSIPLEDKKKVVASALNAFHLMEGLLARLLECVHMKK